MSYRKHLEALCEAARDLLGEADEWGGMPYLLASTPGVQANLEGRLRMALDAAEHFIENHPTTLRKVAEKAKAEADRHQIDLFGAEPQQRESDGWPDAIVM